MMIRNSSMPVDKIEADVVAMTFFEDERPLRGAAGMVDWRLNGAVSRLILNGTSSGKDGESLLMTTNGRITCPRILLFGLGESKRFDAKKFQTATSAFVEVVARLEFSKVAASIPGSSMFSMEKVSDSVIRKFQDSGMPDETEIIIIN